MNVTLDDLILIIGEKEVQIVLLKQQVAVLEKRLAELTPTEAKPRG